MFLQNVKCLRYGTLHYVTWGWKAGISFPQSTVPCIWGGRPV